jgi:hypothetical protein
MTCHPATSQTAPSPLGPFTRFGVIACKSPACFEPAGKTLLQSRCLNPATSTSRDLAHTTQRQHAPTPGREPHGVTCRVPLCKHEGLIFPADLIGRLSPNYPAVSVRRFLRCSSCRATSPNIHEASR